MKGILTDETGDIMIQNGAMVIGNNAADCVQRILEAYSGEFKAQPLLGCNARAVLNGTPSPFWRGEVSSQLRSQGIDADMNFGENGIEIRIKN